MAPKEKMLIIFVPYFFSHVILNVRQPEGHGGQIWFTLDSQSCLESLDPCALASMMLRSELHHLDLALELPPT